MTDSDHSEEIRRLFEKLIGMSVEAQNEELSRLKELHPELFPDLADLVQADSGIETEDFRLFADGAQSNPRDSKTEFEKVGPFRIVRKLGAGGMGAVYEAQHETLGTRCAVKVLLPELTKDPQAVARFQREMKAIGTLSHTNIVQALHAGMENGIHFIGMEYLDGVDLSQLVKSHGPLPVGVACELVRQAAHGLEHANEAGLVHRDIKPSNLMLVSGGSTSGGDAPPIVKILDLGLARLHDKAVDEDELTQTGQIMGTLDYMAPEQGSVNYQVDIRADIYSLGATLFKLLTAVAPYENDKYRTPFEKIRGVAIDPIPDINSLRVGIPVELSKLVNQMLVKEPKERIPSPARVAEKLEKFSDPASLDEILQDATVVTSSNRAARFDDLGPTRLTGNGTTSDPPRKRLMLLSSLAVVALAIVGAFAWSSFFSDQEEQQDDRRSKIISGPRFEANATSHSPLHPTSKKYILNITDEIKQKPISGSALVTRPAAIDGIESWTIETVGHRTGIFDLEFRPDSLTLATSCSDGIVRFWDGRDGKLIKAFVGPGGAWGLSWSPDGKQIAVVYNDSVLIWEFATGKVVQEFNPATRTRLVEWSPNGNLIAVGAREMDVFLWDPKIGKIWKTLKPNFKRNEGTLSWNKDGTKLYMNGKSRVSCFDLLSGEHSKSEYLGWFRELVYHKATGKILLGLNSYLGVFDPDAIEKVVNAANGTIPTVHFLDTNGEIAVSLGTQRHLGIWSRNLELLKSISLPGLPYSSTAIALSSDGTVVAHASVQGLVQIREVPTGNLLFDLPNFNSEVRAAAWSGQKNILASVHSDGSLSTWDGETGTRIDRVENVIQDPNDVVWHNQPQVDELLLCTLRGNGRVEDMLFRVAKVNDQGVIIPGSIRPDRFKYNFGMKLPIDILSRSKTRIFSNRWLPDQLKGWLLIDATDGSKIAEGRDDAVTTPAWTSDGSRLAFARRDLGTVTIIDAENGNELSTFGSHAIPTTAIAWFEKADIIVTASGYLDSLLSFWDSSTGKLVNKLQISCDAHVSSLYFSKDGQSLFVGSIRGKLVVVDTVKYKVIHEIDSCPIGRVSHDGTIVSSVETRRDDVFPGPPGTYARLWDLYTAKPRSTLVSFGQSWLSIDSQGHYQSSPRIESNLIYIAETKAGQQTYTSAEFQQKFGWENSPKTRAK